MLLLISDANILMDVEVGDLVAPMFSLGYQFAVPDVLYYEELEEQHAHLLDMGLQTRTLSPKSVERVQTRECVERCASDRLRAVFLRLRHFRSPPLQELPATTNQLKTRSNKGGGLAHARETTRENGEQRGMRRGKNAGFRGAELARP